MKTVSAIVKFLVFLFCMYLVAKYPESVASVLEFFFGALLQVSAELFSLLKGKLTGV